MKVQTKAVVLFILLLFLTASCESMTAREKGLATGAGVGGGIGALTYGWQGALIGAVAGSVLSVLTIEAASERAAEKAAENRRGYYMRTEDNSRQVVSEYLRYDPDSGCHIVSVSYFVENRPPQTEIKKICD
jgi:hypothetical protein